MSENKLTNKLINEHSLYLLQHSQNPVAWQPWSAETIKLAQELDKPIMISIGYSACHWCHVMEKESFEDVETAEVINKYFVPVKVDKEEYPDVDKRYQFYLQSTGVNGGWPLNCFLMPDGSPFYGGTYYPKQPGNGLPSFKEVLEKVGELYKTNRAHVRETAKNYASFLDEFNEVKFGLETFEETPVSTFDNEFYRIMDMENGGFGAGARFPQIPSLFFLLKRFDRPRTADFLKKTADKLCISGIADHIYGGFFRYTIDKEWHTPHFEKMLYDNALNSLFLTRMYEKTDNMLYLYTARKALDFILDEFNTEFGLISSMDADSLDAKGKLSEGFYYKIVNRDIALFSEDEKKKLFEHLFPFQGVAAFDKPNYEGILKTEKLIEKLRFGAAYKEKPAKDSKVILSWNALFCKALLEYSEVASDEYYFEQAKMLLGKLEHFLIDGTHLRRINYNGAIFDYATLEDYAYTADMYLKFFDITAERAFLSKASLLVEQAIQDFMINGRLHLDRAGKVMDTFDDSLPSAVGVLVAIIKEYGEQLNVTIPMEMENFLTDRIIKYPTAHSTMLSAYIES
jgi:uncharacterized protein YyaL (SSP411 family)